MNLKKILSRISIFVIVFYALICVLVFAFQEKLLFHPEQLPDDFKFQFNHPFTEKNITTQSGNVLNCLYFKADSSKGVVVYFHGNAGSLRVWGEAADIVVENHYDILIPDYAGFGKSKGDISEEILFKDAQSVYDELKKNYSESQIIVCGRSIGTGIAANVAAQNHPEKLILISPYYSMNDLAYHIYPFLPTALLRYPLRTDLCLPIVKCPIRILHGTKDEVIYYESSLKLQKLFKPGDELITIDGAGHNDFTNFDAYYAAVKKVLQ